MIYYKIKPIEETFPPNITEGRLEVLAALMAGEFTKKEAEEKAKASAIYHNMSFEVVKVQERPQGRYHPEGQHNGARILARS